MHKKPNYNTRGNGIHLLIIGALNFPRPSASTTRVWAYSKGLIENSGDATVLCIRPVGLLSSNDTEISVTGTFDHIDYIYASGETMRPKSFVVQLFYELKGFLNSFFIIWRLNRTKKVDAILFYGSSPLNEVAYSLLARVLGIPVIRERCEFPFLWTTRFKNLKMRLYERFVDRLFDGMFIMTRALKDHYKPLMRKDAKYLMVPILVDFSRFENTFSQNDKGRYIAYCGDPSGNKDGVPILLQAFSNVATKYPDVKLYIIGNCGHSQQKGVLTALETQAKNLNISDRVVFTGKIGTEEIPKYLCNATILVLARPTSVQAQYGFPTKLGEYLATGKPVVVTDVGEIAEFLRDEESAYIAQPNSAEAFAAKLDYVLSNYELARKVGNQGKQVAYANFDYRLQGKKITSFIRTLRT